MLDHLVRASLEHVTRQWSTFQGSSQGPQEEGHLKDSVLTRGSSQHVGGRVSVLNEPVSRVPGYNICPPEYRREVMIVRSR